MKHIRVNIQSGPQGQAVFGLVFPNQWQIRGRPGTGYLCSRAFAFQIFSFLPSIEVQDQLAVGQVSWNFLKEGWIKN